MPQLRRCRAQCLLLQRLVCLAGPVQAKAVSRLVVLVNVAVRGLRQVFSDFVEVLEIQVGSLPVSRVEFLFKAKDVVLAALVFR